MKMNDIIFPVMFSVLLVAFVVGFIAHAKFIGILRKRHKNSWERLGKPTLFWNSSISNDLSVQKFISSKGYEELNDKELRTVGNFNRIFNRIYIIVFAIILIVAIWLITKGTDI